MKTQKTLAILFLVVGFGAVAEYMLICGMFTGPLMLGLVLLAGLANFGWRLKSGEVMTALLYLLATLGLGMGYAKLMFF